MLEFLLLTSTTMLAIVVVFLFLGYMSCRKKVRSLSLGQLNLANQKNERKGGQPRVRRDVTRTSEDDERKQHPASGVVHKKLKQNTVQNQPKRARHNQRKQHKEDQEPKSADEQRNQDLDAEPKSADEQRNQGDQEQDATDARLDSDDQEHDATGSRLDLDDQEHDATDSRFDSDDQNPNSDREPSRDTHSLTLVQNLVNRGNNGADCLTSKQAEPPPKKNCYTIKDPNGVHTIFKNIQNKNQGLVFLSHVNASVWNFDLSKYWIAFIHNDNGGFNSKVFAVNKNNGVSEPTWDMVASIYNNGVWKKIDATVKNQLTFKSKTPQVVRVSADHKFIKKIDGKDVQVIATYSSAEKGSVSSEEDITDVHFIYLYENEVKVHVKKNCGQFIEI